MYKEINVKVTEYKERGIEQYVKMQTSYTRVSIIKDVAAIIEILRRNELEHKDKKIYK